MSRAVFSAESLDANRAGRLSDRQRGTLATWMGRRHAGLTGLLSRPLDPIARDVQDGVVLFSEGALTKPPPEQAPSGALPSRHFLDVASREDGVRRFRCDRNLYDFAPAAGFVRLYYLPRTPYAVNLEVLPAAASVGPTPGADMPRQVTDRMQQARWARDRVGMAEAAAQMAALGESMTAAGGAAGPGPGQPADPRALAAALTGTWLSPLMNISLHPDGSFAARFSDGSDHQGQWSVDGAGQLHATIMGAPVAAAATVRGDKLTLVLDGQALTLRRGR
jgi:hypothetical protein